MEDPELRKWLLEPDGIVDRLLKLQGRMKNNEISDRANELPDRANSLPWRPSKVTKLRRAQQTPTEEDIYDWVKVTGGNEDDERQLLALVGEADRHTSSFQRLLQEGQAAHQRSYNERVEQADVIRMVERSFVPSVMQTRAYATAVLTASMKLHKTADDVEEAVTARLERHRFLLDGRHRFEFVIDETVLTRRVAPAEVMYAQVDRILEYMDRPNVRIGILPIYGGFHDVVRNSFELYGKVGVIETYFSDEDMEPAEWKAHVAVMADIWQDAVEGEEAKALLRAAMRRHAADMKRTRKGR